MVVFLDREQKVPQFGQKFKMGGLCYDVEQAGDVSRCKRSCDDQDFPEVVYLQAQRCNTHKWLSRNQYRTWSQSQYSSGYS